MFDNRGEVDLGDVLKVLVVLVVLWFVLEVVGIFLRLTFWFFDILPELLVATVIVLAVLWFMDRR